MTPAEERVARASEIDEQLERLVTRENQTQSEICELLRRMNEDALYSFIGYTSVEHYARSRFGYSTRQTSEKVELAERLEKLPRLAELFRSGKIGWTKAREAARGAAAQPEKEEEWCEHAQTKSKHELERLAAEANGELPTITVVLKLTPEEHALFREALKAARREPDGGKLSEGAALAETCRRALSGKGGLGGPKHRIHLGACAECEAAWRETPEGREKIDLPSFDYRACDAEVVTSDGRLVRTIPSRVRRAIEVRDNGRCRVPGCPNTLWVEAHHEGGWRVVGHDAEKMFLMCGTHHRARHEGALRATLAGTILRFFLADGRQLGDDIDLSIPKRSRRRSREEGDLIETAYRELLKLEVPDLEARRRIAATLAVARAEPWTPGAFVRAALQDTG